MRIRVAGALLPGLLIIAAIAAPAAGQYESPEPSPSGPSGDTTVDANGNPFTGGLSFTPARVRVRVGDTVRWRNTDFLVPHTATEDHELWDLSGDYGLPGQTGFGPGDTVERRFEAGTHSYFCEIHPEDMRGTVEVPVALKLRKGEVAASWAPSKPSRGLVFDVQRRKGSGKWKSLEAGTRSARGSFDAGKRGTRWQVRARVGRKDDPSARTGYSPVGVIKA